MMLKLLSALLYAVRWLVWLMTYAFVWPAATLMLLIIMLFWMENTTPGEAMAQEVAAITHNVNSGEFRIFACRDEPAQPLIPTAPQDKSPGLMLHGAPPAICHDRGSVVTGAKGYAAHINDSLRVVTGLWAVLAIVFSALALLMGCRPYFCRDGQMRSALFRYSPPASYPIPATEAVKTAANKKEGEHE